MTHGNPRASRRHTRRWGALCVLTLLALVGALALQPWAGEGPGRGLAGAAKVSASSTAFGHSPRDAVTAASPEGDPGWRSAGETDGAWIELSWTEEHLLQRVTLVQPRAGAAVTDGFLAFGDGSFLQIRLSPTSSTTVVPFTPRSVDRVRFTASAVVPGASDVALTGFDVDAGPGGVASDDAAGGDVAPRALPAAGADRPGAGPAAAPTALVDGTQAPDGAGADWTVDGPQGRWVDLTWPAPRELAAVQVVGSARTASRLAGATVEFGDGARLPVGAVLPEPGRPTTVAFMPRVTSSVRLHLDRVEGDGPLALAELRVFDRGSTPTRTPTGPPAPVLPSPAVCVPPAVAPAPASGLAVLCPLSGSTVEGRVTVRTATAPGYTRVDASFWSGDVGLPPGPAVSAVPDPAGQAQLLADVPPGSGPVTLAVTAEGDGVGTRTVTLAVLVPGPSAGPVPSSTPATGRTLVHGEEFTRPVSSTRTGAGADYAAGKPTHDGAEDFGDAAFADPASGLGTTEVVAGDHLRVGVRPTPPGAGTDRAHLGGLLASARTGGSGFSAQYGYFEARMLAPAAEGTWPAFWMLPADNLVAPTPVVAEVDAVELYGHEPTGACHSTHEFADGTDGGVARCGERFGSAREALGWHTYGVSVAPTGNTFYLDGRVVAVAPQVRGGGSPLFFLVDLALGGGWPVDLAPTAQRADLFVDYVRVYV